MKVLLLLLFYLFFVVGNGFVLHKNKDTEVLAGKCNGYESTTKVTIYDDFTAKFVISYSFVNESFIATFVNFTSTYPTYLTLQVFSNDAGYQYCNVTTGAKNYPCTFKQSTTNTYSLDYYMSNVYPEGIILTTIMTSKTLEITHPSVDRRNPCQDSSGTATNLKTGTEFCCII